MTTMTALTDMPDADLLEACQAVADELAHFEAADGLTYSRESDERERAQMRWRSICAECLRRGLQPKFKLM